MRLYHVSDQVVKKPDIYYGRENADFGRGFYLSDDIEFSKRWVSDSRCFINAYQLDTEDLDIICFERNEEWFDYIVNNRKLIDLLPGKDAVIGPVNNDTIFNVMGITTSGYLSREEALKLAMLGPVYKQVVLKTEKAISQLKWLEVLKVDPQSIQQYRETVKKEEREFQVLFAKVLNEV